MCSWSFPTTPPRRHLSFSPDGSHLLGTSYYTGVSNVFRYDLASRTQTVLTNAETGYFRPMVFSDDSLIAFEYSGEGFLPVMLRTGRWKMFPASSTLVRKLSTGIRWSGSGWSGHRFR